MLQCFIFLFLQLTMMSCNPDYKIKMEHSWRLGVFELSLSLTFQEFVFFNNNLVYETAIQLHTELNNKLLLSATWHGYDYHLS